MQELRDYLESIGLAHCTETVLNDGLFLSLRSLRDATYKELLECRLTPAQVISILVGVGAPAPPMETTMDQFFSTAGVDIGTKNVVALAGCTSISALRAKSEVELALLGLPPEQVERILSHIAAIDDSGLLLASPAVVSESSAQSDVEESRMPDSSADVVPSSMAGAAEAGLLQERLPPPAALSGSGGSAVPVTAPVAAPAEAALEGVGADEDAVSLLGGPSKASRVRGFAIEPATGPLRKLCARVPALLQTCACAVEPPVRPSVAQGVGVSLRGACITRVALLVLLFGAVATIGLALFSSPRAPPAIPSLAGRAGGSHSTGQHAGVVGVHRGRAGAKGSGRAAKRKGGTQHHVSKRRNATRAATLNRGRRANTTLAS